MKNLAYCRQYFAGDSAIKFHHCNGFDLSGLPDGFASFFYTFDSMVHFDVEIIASYLHEFRRVIRPGGMAFIRHSNYSGSPGSRFQDTPHWRNYMSATCSRHLSLRAGACSASPGRHLVGRRSRYRLPYRALKNALRVASGEGEARLDCSTTALCILSGIPKAPWPTTAKTATSMDLPPLIEKGVTCA